MTTENPKDQNAHTLKIELDVNSFMPAGGTRLNGSFIVSPEGFDGATVVYLPRYRCAVGDSSGSMDRGKLTQLKAALRAFVQNLPENDYFTLVHYASSARYIFPAVSSSSEVAKPVLATPDNKALALKAIDSLLADGNTYPSTGIQKAFDSFLLSPCNEATVIFLTDGQFNSEDAQAMEKLLLKIEAARNDGRSFKIYPRGIGTDFVVGELHKMASRTFGTAPKVVANPEDLQADFTDWVEKASKASLGDVRVKLWFPVQVKLLEFKRIAPTIIPMKDSFTVEADGNTHVLTLGSFPATEASEYFFSLALTAKEPGGKPIRAAKLKMTYAFGTEVFSVPGAEVNDWYLIEAQWTDDAGLSSRIPMGVARAQDKIEMATAIQEGLAAMDKNEEEATRKLGRAVQLAAEAGDEEMTARLKKIVDVQSAEEGTVTLKRNINKADKLTLDAESSTMKVARKPA